MGKYVCLAFFYFNSEMFVSWTVEDETWWGTLEHSCSKAQFSFSFTKKEKDMLTLSN